MKEIMVPYEEYKKLLELQIKLNMFIDHEKKRAEEGNTWIDESYVLDLFNISNIYDEAKLKRDKEELWRMKIDREMDEELNNLQERINFEGEEEGWTNENIEKAKKDIKNKYKILRYDYPDYIYNKSIEELENLLSIK